MTAHPLIILETRRAEALARAEQDYDRVRARIEAHYQAEKALIEDDLLKMQDAPTDPLPSVTPVELACDHEPKGFFARLWGGR